MTGGVWTRLSPGVKPDGDTMTMPVGFLGATWPSAKVDRR